MNSKNTILLALFGIFTVVIALVLVTNAVTQESNKEPNIESVDSQQDKSTELSQGDLPSISTPKRRNDAGYLEGYVYEYVSNNNGRQPSSVEELFADVSQIRLTEFTQNEIDLLFYDEDNTPVPSKQTIQLVFGAECTEQGGLQTAGRRSFAVRFIALEDEQLILDCIS